MKRYVAVLVLASLIGVGCVDITPTAERDRMVLLAPPAARGAIDMLLSTYSGFGTTMPPAALYMEASQLLRVLDEDPRVAVVATFDDQVVAALQARGRITDLAVIAAAGLVVAGNVRAGNMMELVEASPPIAIQGRAAGTIGSHAYDALLRYGVLTRLDAALRPTRGSEESLELLRSGSVEAVILLAPEAIDSNTPVLFAFDPAVDNALELQLLLLHEEHADARPVFEQLRSAAGGATFVAHGWSAPR